MVANHVFLAFVKIAEKLPRDPRNAAPIPQSVYMLIYRRRSVCMTAKRTTRIISPIKTAIAAGLPGIRDRTLL